MPFSPSYDVSDDRSAYTFRRGPVGCLMLHGFMGSPISSRPMSEYLAERGITVHCPLLPGHGELPEKMAGVRHEAWLAEAEEAFEAINAWCDDVFIMSHSMGTVMAAHLAQQHAQVKGLIMLAPLYKPPSRVISLLRVIRHVMPWFYPWRIKRLRKLARERLLDLYPDLDLEDPGVQAWIPQATRVPTGAIDEMRKMADLGRKLWPQLNVPALIIQGEKDIAVKPGNTQAIYDMISVDDKALHMFPNAGHELMRPFDPHHRKVWPLVYDFVAAHASVVLEAPPAEAPAA